MDPAQAEEMLSLLKSIDASLLKLLELQKTNYFGLDLPSYKDLKTLIENIVSTAAIKT